MFGNLLDDVEVGTADSSSSSSGTNGSATHAAVPRQQPPAPQQSRGAQNAERKKSAPVPMSTGGDTGPRELLGAAPDVSSAEDEYRSRKKRRQQNSKRLGLPEGLVTKDMLQVAPREATTSDECDIEIKDLEDFLRDHPYLADGKSSTSSERCVGTQPGLSPPSASTDTKDNGNSNSNSNTTLPMDTSDAKKPVTEQVYEEQILREPEEFPLLRELMRYVPVCHWMLSERMLKQGASPDDALRYLLAKKARLPISYAEHDNKLIAEAGSFTSTDPAAVPGKVYAFPPCARGEECVGVTASQSGHPFTGKVDGLPEGHKGKILTQYMDEMEFNEFLRTGTAPAGARYCRDCGSIIACLLVLHVRAYAMLEPSAAATHALAQKAFVNGAGGSKSETKHASFGGNSDLHRKCNASLVRMADTLCLYPFSCLVNQPGGYISEAVLQPDSRHYEGLIGNVVRFRSSYRQWVFNQQERRWYLSQDAMIWRPPAVAADCNLDIGDALHHF